MSAPRLGRAPWRRLFHGVYVWGELAETPELLISAAMLRLPDDAVFSGLTAAWLHGLDVTPCTPIEATRPYGGAVSGRAAIRIRRTTYTPEDVVVVRGFRTTSIARTLQDLSATRSLTESVVLIDMALNRGLTTQAALLTHVAKRSATSRASAFRKAMTYAEPLAESPMETRLRMLLVLAGLPRPEAQVKLYDEAGQFIGRPDLYYPDIRLGIEYDGGTHHASLAADNRRQNLLLANGIRLLRFTGADVGGDPAAIAMQVRRLRTPSRRVA
jgi:very-short-patch-repair endonuclease